MLSGFVVHKFYARYCNFCAAIARNALQNLFTLRAYCLLPMHWAVACDGHDASNNTMFMNMNAAWLFAGSGTFLGSPGGT